MKCPFCGSQETKVVDKRESENNESTRRRRECLKCSKRFTTYERIETSSLRIIKKDGVRQEFDRDKILKGLIRACEKRPVTQEMINQTATEIESELRKTGEGEITSKVVGKLLMKKLKVLDKVAYIRFASVYQEFEDVNDFNKEIKKLAKKQEV